MALQPWGAQHRLDHIRFADPKLRQPGAHSRCPARTDRRQHKPPVGTELVGTVHIGIVSRARSLHHDLGQGGLVPAGAPDHHHGTTPGQESLRQPSRTSCCCSCSRNRATVLASPSASGIRARQPRTASRLTSSCFFGVPSGLLASQWI